MKGKIIGIGLVCALIVSIATVIIFVEPINVSTSKEKNEFKDWIRSGPFSINKSEYRIGENIFIRVDGLTTDDVGNSIFVLPNGITKYISIPFDGTIKSGFNQYFEPGISKNRKICSVEDLVGEWTVVFQGTEYESLKFRIINETLPGEVGTFERIC